MLMLGGQATDRPLIGCGHLSLTFFSVRSGGESKGAKELRRRKKERGYESKYPAEKKKIKIAWPAQEVGLLLLVVLCGTVTDVEEPDEWLLEPTTGLLVLDLVLVLAWPGLVWSGLVQSGDG